MPFIEPESRPEPFLILTGEDYSRAVAPKVPAPPLPEAAPGVRRRSPSGWLLGLGVLLAAGGAAIVLRQGKPQPPARGVERPPEFAGRRVVPPSKREPAPLPRRVPPGGRPVRSGSEDAEEEAPPPVPRPAGRDPGASWNGGRTWVQARLRMESSSGIQESEHRVTIAWDGARWSMERPAGQTPDLRLERLDLLLHLPSENETWERQPRQSGQETLQVRAGGLRCRFVEGEDFFPQGARHFRYSCSDEFPIGAVLAQVKFRDMSLECRVLDYGAAPVPAQKP